MERFLAGVPPPEWKLEQDAGRTWDEAVEALTRQHPEHAELIAAYRDRWTETLDEAIGPTVVVLDELRQTGVRPFALTHRLAEEVPVARPRYPFLAWRE